MKTRAIGFFTVVFSTFAVAAAEAPAPPTAAELLDKYKQALQSVHSIIARAEIEEEHDWAYSRDWNEPGFRGTGHKGTIYERVEVRTDGERVHYRSYSWGQISPTVPYVAQNAPSYQCRNYANGELYRHSMTVNTKGKGGLVMLSKLQHFHGESIDKFRGYYLQGPGRLDAILAGAKTISVRPRTDQARRSDCYVIDAQTELGRVSVWIDPAHGYHLARVQATGTEGDLYYAKALGRGQVVSNYVEIQRFDKIGGIWVPMEMDYIRDDRFGPGSYSRSREHYKRTEVLLNPDHKALGSFDNPIENPKNDPHLISGTAVSKADEHGMFIWQHGKLIPDQSRRR